jgi:hypothetical protein
MVEMAHRLNRRDTLNTECLKGITLLARGFLLRHRTVTGAHDVNTAIEWHQAGVRIESQAEVHEHYHAGQQTRLSFHTTEYTLYIQDSQTVVCSSAAAVTDYVWRWEELSTLCLARRRDVDIEAPRAML